MCMMCAVHAVPGCVNITHINASNNSIEVHWNAPDKPNGVITQYVINFTTPGGTTYTNTTRNTFCIIPSLPSYTNYTITVAAETKLGVGQVSGCPLSTTLAATKIGSENYHHRTQTSFIYSFNFEHYPDYQFVLEHHRV